MADAIPILVTEHFSLQLFSKELRSQCFSHLLTHPILVVLAADQSQTNETLALSISKTESQTHQDSPKVTTQLTA